MTRPTVHALPRSIDQVSGLRVARWVRESTAGQYDNWGPDAQRELQDRIIERYRLIDTGRAATTCSWSAMSRGSSGTSSRP